MRTEETGKNGTKKETDPAWQNAESDRWLLWPGPVDRPMTFRCTLLINQSQGAAAAAKY